MEYSLLESAYNVSTIFNSGPTEIQYWLALNKLRLNIDKTKFTVFHPYQKDITRLIPTLKINDIDIKWVTALNCLGILFDDNVS